MADNLLYSEPGSGKPVKTDEVGSDHYQVMKIDLGPDGQAIPINGSVPVTIVSGSITSLPNITIGAALPTGDNNIGNVDVLSSALPTGAATAANQLPDGHNVTVDNATGASAVFVQGQAADGAAVAGNPVRMAGKDGSGNTQDIATDTSGELQVDVLSSALPTGAATAANQLADGHNVTIDNTGSNPVIVSGIVFSDGPVSVIKFVEINATADGDNTIIAAVSNRKIRILGYVVTATGIGNLLLQDSNNTVWGRVRSGADGGGASFAGGVYCPAFQTAAINVGIEINCPAGVDALGHITYMEVL